LKLDAYGTVDELNSFIGLLIEEAKEEHDKKILSLIQDQLFTVGSYLATEAENTKSYVFKQEIIDLLEHEIDEIDASLPKLSNFILPGGSKAAAAAHICRTVCRRAERCIYKVKEYETIDTLLLNFINRLSDYFFILARKLCLADNGHEIIWKNSWK
jgi:cob(I)alamin adenosyltransferase